MENEKTFYDIRKLSETFDEFKYNALGTGSNVRTMDLIQIWQASAQLAIAQQLSVISGTLSDLLALCKSQSKSKK